MKQMYDRLQIIAFISPRRETNAALKPKGAQNAGYKAFILI